MISTYFNSHFNICGFGRLVTWYILVFHKFFRVTNGTYLFLFILVCDEISVILKLIDINLNFII